MPRLAFNPYKRHKVEKKTQNDSALAEQVNQQDLTGAPRSCTFVEESATHSFEKGATLWEELVAVLVLVLGFGASF